MIYCSLLVVCDGRRFNIHSQYIYQPGFTPISSPPPPISEDAKKAADEADKLALKAIEANVAAAALIAAQAAVPSVVGVVVDPSWKTWTMVYPDATVKSGCTGFKSTVSSETYKIADEFKFKAGLKSAEVFGRLPAGFAFTSDAGQPTSREGKHAEPHIVDAAWTCMCHVFISALYPFLFASQSLIR